MKGRRVPNPQRMRQPFRKHVDCCVDGLVERVSEKIPARHGLDARIHARMFRFEFRSQLGLIKSPCALGHRFRLFRYHGSFSGNLASCRPAPIKLNCTTIRLKTHPPASRNAVNAAMHCCSTVSGQYHGFDRRSPVPADRSGDLPVHQTGSTVEIGSCLLTSRGRRPSVAGVSRSGDRGTTGLITASSPPHCHFPPTSNPSAARHARSRSGNRPEASCRRRRCCPNRRSSSRR